MAQHQRNNNNGINWFSYCLRRDPAPGSDGLMELQSFRHYITVAPKRAKSAKSFMSKFSKTATWNVRTLSQVGKLHNFLAELDRMEIHCIGLCEVKWPKSADIARDKKWILFSRGDQHHCRIALILNSTFGSSVLSSWPKSDHLLLVKLKSSPFNANILVAYVPTAEAEDHDIDSFYGSLDELYSVCENKLNYNCYEWL